MNEFIYESNKLDDTVEKISSQISKEKQELENLYNNHLGTREELWKSEDIKKMNIHNLESSLNNPYFSRIDFLFDDNSELASIYIGKKGIDYNGQAIVTDWRAPISSLYYDSEVGKTSFEAPSGIMRGDLKLKRQFDIENGKLIDYYDVDIVSRDELLQKYLNSNNDSRLKSIVSTIQKEQNEVVRKKINDNIIVQGVAGSGKTTVALHRIAYLVYNYINTVHQNQYLVIGPNPVFLKYIKSVLPDLDVSGINQLTYEQFASEYINADIIINSSEKKIIQNIAGKINNDIDKFKCSMQYKEMIDIFIKTYMYSITSKPIVLKNFEIISAETIKEIFESTSDIYHVDLKTRIDLTIDRICKYIENDKSHILTLYNKYIFDEYEKVNSPEEKNKLKNVFSKDREEISKNCRNIVKRYFSNIRVDILKLYRIFVESISQYNKYNYENINLLKKETLSNIKQNKYDFEDLAALMYIKSIISPDKNYNKIKEVVIDEAQDLGEFNFYVLKECLPAASFSIFGDIAQSIYDYRGINSWEDVNRIMFNNNGNIINFNKSYRTTSEIMDVADDISEYIGLSRSEDVIRHGSEVKFTETPSENDIPVFIANKIKEFVDKGYKTIAIISKTELLSRYINDDLKMIGVNIPNVTINDDLTDEKFQVCTISNQLAKGLEFDAVIINNACERIYSSSSRLDAKLLYVATTRALHELEIVYSGEINNILNYRAKNNKEISRIKKL